MEPMDKKYNSKVEKIEKNRIGPKLAYTTPIRKGKPGEFRVSLTHDRLVIPIGSAVELMRDEEYVYLVKSLRSKNHLYPFKNKKNKYVISFSLKRLGYAFPILRRKTYFDVKVVKTKQGLAYRFKIPGLKFKS